MNAARGVIPIATMLVLTALVASSFGSGNGGAIAPSNQSAFGSAHATPAASPAAARVVGDSATTTVVPAHVAAPSAPSGPGTFFQTSLVPNPLKPICLSTYQCFNNTDEPSLNLTTNGYLGVAYTVYTNNTPCTSEVNYTTTRVGFSASTTLGKTWGAAKYLSDPTCTGYDANFPDAAQPTLTSLSNGTLVMAYEQFNFSVPTDLAPEFYCGEVSYDRIVVTESFDNGSTWTVPTVLDTTSFGGNTTSCPSDYPDLQPWVTAIGQTVYVAWTNYTNYYFCPYSSEVDFRASTNGGSTWSTESELPVVDGSWPGCVPSTFVNAASPAMTVAPDGTLYVAYLTGMGLVNGYECSNCYEGVHMELASSTNNGSSWTTSTVSDDVVSDPYFFCCASSPFWGAQPSIAYGVATKQVYVAWSSISFGDYCEIYYGTDACYAGEEVASVTVANSSDGGATFTQHPIIQPIFDPNGGPMDEMFNPSIGVTANGVLHLQANFENDSICTADIYGSACGAQQQIYLNSTDNGTDWSHSVVVYYNYTPGCGYPFYEECSWAGQFSSMVTTGNTVLLAWTWQGCSFALTNICEFYFNPGPTQVAVSQLFSGSGVTITFKPTGLPATATWSVNMMGNYRVGSGSTSLSVSGVPANVEESYTIPWVNTTWGHAYGDTISPSGPASFSTSTTVTVAYQEFVRYEVDTQPILPAYDWEGFGYSDYTLSPLPQVYWISPNSTQSETINHAALTFCYPCVNLTFLAWNGVGPGSVTTTSPNITLSPSGPVNETATFDLNGFCDHNYVTGATVCVNNTFYPMTFVEKGLPNGTGWGATVGYPNGTIVTNTTTARADGFLVPVQAVNFTLWTVPDPTSGDVWVPSTATPSPAEPPSSDLIPVRYTKEAASAAVFPDRFSETGLPSGTDWSVTISNRSFGITNGNLTIDLSGGRQSVNGSAVYTESGTGYYAGSISIAPYTTNESATTVNAPALGTWNGSVQVTINYKPMYQLVTVAGPGGAVSPPSAWVPGTASVQLGETPNAGYHFAGWTGTGSGATTTAQDSQTNPTITLKGPVTELATFRLNGKPTWNLTVTPVGLAPGAAFTVSLGGQAYTESTAFDVGNLTGGNYSVAVPDAYLNSSQTTRFVATSVTSDLAFPSAGTLDIDQNGTLTVQFATQFELALAQTPPAGGTISPSPGVYWETSGATVALTATPGAGYVFLGWNATTSAGVTTAAAATNVTLTAPATETAQFAVRPPGSAAEFSLNVTESGLPSGLSWNVSIGTTGAVGTAVWLLVGGLNGTYPFSVPDVYAGAGVRYVAAGLSGNQTTVTANRSISVAFDEQFALTVTATFGGEATASSGVPVGWAAPGSTVTLGATPLNASYEFANWTGSGSGAYSGGTAASRVTVGGPITELATFVPVPVTHTSAPTTSNGNTGLLVSIGLLVGLLVVGAVIGMLVRRSRTPPATPMAEPEPMDE